MLTPGVFTVHKFDIHMDGQNDPVSIFPLGDIHMDSPFHAEEEYDDTLRTIRKRKNGYVIGLGDYTDFGSTSERKGLRNAELHKQTMENIENKYVMSIMRQFAKRWMPFKDKIIGLVEGNHYYQMEDGRTSTQVLCDILGCKYLGTMSMIRLVLSPDKDYDSRNGYIYDICAYHGKGAARLLGSALNTVQYMAEGMQADLYLMGHDHNRGAVPGTVGMLQTNKTTGEVELKHRDRYFVRTGSFLKAFIDGKSSYIADKGGGARALGSVEVQLKLTQLRIKKKNENDKRPRIITTKVIV